MYHLTKANNLKQGRTEIRCKLWVEHDDALVFGDGRKALLEAIDELGSINEAAVRFGMSYRAAWGKIKATEERWGVRLLDRHVGGRGGGGATLTLEARALLEHYDRFLAEAQASVAEKFASIFLSQFRAPAN